jgi:hypothetical protein
MTTAAAAAGNLQVQQQQQQALQGQLQPSPSTQNLKQPAAADDVNSSSGSSSSNVTPAHDIKGTAAAAAVDVSAAALDEPPSVADLDVVVKAFDTRK